MKKTINKPLLKQLKQAKKDAKKMKILDKKNIEWLKRGIERVKKGRPRITGYEKDLIDYINNYKG